MTSGALRKKGFGVAARAARESGKGFELVDSDDDEELIRRIKMRYSKYISKNKGGEGTTISEKYAANPRTAAFAQAMNIDFDDMGGYLQAEEEENEPEVIVALPEIIIDTSEIEQASFNPLT